jgi:hypothetical protein
VPALPTGRQAQAGGHSSASPPKARLSRKVDYYRYVIKMSEAPRPQGGASRQGMIVHIVPLYPAYETGLAGHVPVRGGRDVRN